MRKAWKDLDLEGGGLQTLNAKLASEMRSRPAAYVAWVLFPLGLHRFYLREPLGGAGFLALSALAIVFALFAPALWWLVPALGALLWAGIDLVWIDRRVTTYNKELRKQLFLRKGQRPPQDYRGRYTSDEDARRELQEYQAIKERERAGHPAAGAQDTGSDSGGRSRLPSFNEQEAMLREMQRNRGQQDRGEQ